MFTGTWSYDSFRALRVKISTLSIMHHKINKSDRQTEYQFGKIGTSFDRLIMFLFVLVIFIHVGKSINSKLVGISVQFRCTIHKKC